MSDDYYSEDSSHFGNALKQSSHTEDQEWPAAYYGLFGRRLGQDEVDAIETELRNVFRARPLKDWETTKAVRRIAREAAPGQARKFPPGGEEIIKAIKQNRFDYFRENVGTRQQLVLDRHGVQTPDGRLIAEHRRVMMGDDQWRQALKDAPTPDARWSVICEPCHDADCKDREKFCLQNGLDFERYVPDFSLLDEATAEVTP